MDPALTSELEKDLFVSFTRGGKKVSNIYRYKSIDFFLSKFSKNLLKTTDIFTFFSTFGIHIEKSSIQFCGIYGKMRETR